MWKVSILAILVTIITLVVTGNWWVSLIIGIIFTATILILKAGIVVVPACTGAVIFNHLNFYTGLRGPGAGFIFPFWEHVAFYLNLRLKAIRITVRDIHTRDQIPVAISVDLTYRLDPWQMRPELRPQLIDRLERVAETVLQRQVKHLLRNLVGQQKIASLTQPDVRTYLEDHLTNDLPPHVSWLGIILSGRVMLGNIVLPEVVQAEINQAQLVRIQTQAKADALNVLGEALGAQPDQAWKKVIEVEAIDALAQNGVPVFHPYSSTYWSGGISRNRTDGNI